MSRLVRVGEGLTRKRGAATASVYMDTFLPSDAPHGGVAVVRLREGAQTGTTAVDGNEGRLVHFRDGQPVKVTFHYIEEGVDVHGLPESQAIASVLKTNGVRVIGLG